MNLNNEFDYIAKSGAKVSIIFHNSNSGLDIYDNAILSGGKAVFDVNILFLLKV